jgi:BirA family biotin operon repressor/biotin-[acetyl-CoA-carboxylase] ligase
MTPMSTGLDWVDVDRLLEAGWLGSCEVLDAVDSTNTFAMHRALRVEPRELPLLIIAHQQSSGRGRGANAWWSSEGSLTFSLLIAPSVFGLKGAQWPTLSVLAGSSVCTALGGYCKSDAPRLKWPNDVFLRARKVCGILVEAHSTSEDRVVIGVGINANNSLADAPAELRGTATSLVDSIGTQVDRLDVLMSVLEQIQRDLDRLSNAESSLLATWRSQCLLTGRQIAVDDLQRRIEGTCLGIDDDGALRVQTRFGPQRVVSGVVKEFA